MHLKKTSFLIIKILIAVFAYSYIVCKFIDYELVIHNFILTYQFDERKLLLFTAAVLLMPVNWSIEAIKWQKLVEKFNRIRFFHSLKAVLAGITTGIFTPNRIGEFAGRPYFTDKKKISSGLFAGFAGSLSQSLITVFMGVLALNIYLIRQENYFFIDAKYLYAVLGFSILLLIFFSYLFFHISLLFRLKKYFSLLKKYEKDILFLSKFSKSELRKILFYGFSRYLIFFTQYYLILSVFDVQINVLEGFIAIALVYLFLFSIPSVAFTELGIRGSLSVFFIGMYSGNYTGILMASVLIWFVNVAVPAVVGTIIILFERYK